MKLQIRHSTLYTYDSAGGQLIQRLHLTPESSVTQSVKGWQINAPGIERGISYRDAFGNMAHLVTSTLDSGEISVEVEARGVVETTDKAGNMGPDGGWVPVGAYLAETEITRSNTAIRALARKCEARQGLNQAHDLMGLVREAIAYEIGTSISSTTAAEALKAGTGVCQDHAHVFISAARVLGIPARYVSGYLATGTDELGEASHAWAELYMADLGWVGFDVSNTMSPDDRYVRVAVAMDIRGAQPVTGVRRGPGDGNEKLRVEVLVDPAPDQ
jgi:transglutaminase-like putative cysteine protease